MTSIKQSYQGSTAKLILLALGLFVAATNAFVIAGLLPDIARTLGVSATDVSVSITTYSLLVAVASPVVSIVLARVPRALLMAAGLAVFAVGTAIAASSTGLGEFIFGRTFSGLGAAALVPTATAAATSLTSPEKRGRALAIVGAGFTLATAVGSPLGTALGAAAGWRTPMWVLVGIAAVLVIALPLAVRGVPLGQVISIRRRIAVLGHRRILAPLGAILFTVAGFNLVYIFSAAVTAPSTGGSGSILAVLLLGYGVAGIVGNLLAGPGTDRLGNRRTAMIALGGQFVALAILAFVETSFVATLAVFAAWGFAAFAIAIPVQHRLVQVAPESAAVTLAWYSTAMYLGIAIAPPLGTTALALGGPTLVPIVGAVVTLLAFGLFLAGFGRRDRPTDISPGTVPAVSAATA